MIKKWYLGKMISWSGVEASFCVHANSKNHARRLMRERTRSYQFVRFEFVKEVPPLK